jgi:hypothetical protein
LQSLDYKKIAEQKMSKLGKGAHTFLGVGSSDVIETLDSFMLQRRNSAKEEQRLKRERELEEARLASRAHQKDIQAKQRPSSRSSGDSTPRTPANAHRRGSELSRMGLVGGMVAAAPSQASSPVVKANVGRTRSSDEKLTLSMHKTLDMTATLQLQLTLCPAEGKLNKTETSTPVDEHSKDLFAGCVGLSLEDRYINEVSRLEGLTSPQIEWGDLTRNPYDSGRNSPLELSCNSWQHVTKLGPEQLGSTLALSMSLTGELAALANAQAAF